MILVGVLFYSIYPLGIAYAIRRGAPADSIGFFGHWVCLAATVGALTAGRRWNLAWLALTRHWKLFGAISLLGAGVAYNSVHGIKHSGLGGMGVLAPTDVLFTVLLGWLWFHERIRRASLIAVCLMAAGAAIRVFGSASEATRAPAPPAVSQAASTTEHSAPGGEIAEPSAPKPARDARWQRLKGDFFVIAYAFCLALNAFCIKLLLKHVSWDVVLLGNYAARLILFLSVSLLTGQLGPGWQTIRSDPRVAAAAVWMGAALTVGMWLYYSALATIPVWVAKVFMLFGPFFFLVFDFVFFGQAPGAAAYLSFLLIVSGGAYIIASDPLFRRGNGGAPAEAP